MRSWAWNRSTGCAADVCHWYDATGGCSTWPARRWSWGCRSGCTAKCSAGRLCCAELLVVLLVVVDEVLEVERDEPFFVTYPLLTFLFVMLQSFISHTSYCAYGPHQPKRGLLLMAVWYFLFQSSLRQRLIEGTLHIGMYHSLLSSHFVEDFNYSHGYISGLDRYHHNVFRKDINSSQHNFWSFKSLKTNPTDIVGGSLAVCWRKSTVSLCVDWWSLHLWGAPYQD